VDRARHWSIGDGVWGNHSVFGVSGGVSDPYTALVGSDAWLHDAASHLTRFFFATIFTFTQSAGVFSRKAA
jgi:hypothetical protein